MKKFYNRIKINPNTQCWEWQGAKQPEGYGRVSGKIWNGHYLLHRWSYEYHKGPIPQGLLVRHLCNNPCCANPDHLEVGTVKDNAQDREKSPNHLRGSQNPFHILTEKQVKEIKRDYIPGTGKYNPGNIRMLCAKYNISKSTIQLIAKGERWKHI